MSYQHSPIRISKSNDILSISFHQVAGEQSPISLDDKICCIGELLRPLIWLASL
jgi:hypothetical protein